MNQANQKESQNAKDKPKYFVLSEKNLSSLPKKLWEMRTSQELSQKYVGEKMKVLQSHVSTIENSRNPKVPLLTTLVKYLNIVGAQIVIILPPPKGAKKRQDGGKVRSDAAA